MKQHGLCYPKAQALGAVKAKHRVERTSARSRAHGRRHGRARVLGAGLSPGQHRFHRKNKFEARLGLRYCLCSMQSNRVWALPPSTRCALRRGRKTSELRGKFGTCDGRNKARDAAWNHDAIILHHARERVDVFGQQLVVAKRANHVGHHKINARGCFPQSRIALNDNDIGPAVVDHHVPQRNHCVLILLERIHVNFSIQSRRHFQHLPHHHAPSSSKNHHRRNCIGVSGSITEKSSDRFTVTSVLHWIAVDHVERL
mmetsp:Transcript_13654/g.36669  ORF Transcript_13654/g.36669 Transcript_13654/m.36669 type:complete len:257 (-) Transcript_13654:1037-1807(-)